MPVPRLSAALVKAGHPFPSGLVVQPLQDLPEKVLQFGEGNFLRAFVDWMIGRMNARGLFNGRAVVVQPIPAGRVETLNAQDGLYTVVLRGLRGGTPAEEPEVVTAVSRGLNPFADFSGLLACAENPALRFIVSNTTEAGIAVSEADRPDDRPPASFPAKLTRFLHHRFQHFSGAADKGCVMLPCELIERNGDALKACVLATARRWNLELPFVAWIETHNEFANTLVDRIVTGYPKSEADRLTAALGYRDELLDTAELFHLWVIESRWDLSEEFPLTQAGLDVVWTPNMTPYRDRKVRILNGAHTMMVSACYLAGKDTVGQCMADPVLRRFVERAVSDEIIPTLDLPREDLEAFAAAVLERFANPHITHYLLSLALNSTSKYRARVLPSVIEHRRRTGALPRRLCFALAAQIRFYRGMRMQDGMLVGERDGKEYPIADDRPVQEFFLEAWRTHGSSAGALAERVLGSTTLWGENLAGVPGLVAEVAGHLGAIERHGIVSALQTVA
jgi:tagaturonate reductase